MATAPVEDRITKAAFELFRELNCVRGREGDDDAALTSHDVERLDEEKMMARALDCLAAVCEAQRVRVARKQQLKLQDDGAALTSEQQVARNKVFRAALNVVADGLTHDGAAAATRRFSMRRLLRAFPDVGKLTDGRGWLPMHWAVIAHENDSDVTEADVMCVYETDPMALRKHHLVGINDEEPKKHYFGFTVAHLLCGLEMTARNMSLVRHFSLSDPQAFTMKVSDVATAVHSWSALHVACRSCHRTEGLLRLLVQLDASQMKSIKKRTCGPLGLLCMYSVDLDVRLVQCLAEADSSVEVVCDGIIGCFANSDLNNPVRAVAKLLKVNPAAAQHKAADGHNLAHEALIQSNSLSAGDCIGVLKLLLARHKDALKEADLHGMLPAHFAAQYGPLEVLDFVLSEYPGAAAMVDNFSRTLLHIAAIHMEEEHLAATVCLLCARHSHMMLQRNFNGVTPLLRACFGGHGATARLLCEAGGQEAASAAVVHPTNAQDTHNGRLPLHYLIEFDADTLISAPLSEAADAFRLLLRLYPEAAGTEGGVGVGYKITPYQLAVENYLPAYYRRLLLRAAPHLDLAELRRLNWAERRMAMFVAFRAVSAQPSLLARLRAENKDLVKHVMSFL